MTTIPLTNDLNKAETVSAVLVEHANPEAQTAAKPEARVRIARYDQM